MSGMTNAGKEKRKMVRIRCAGRLFTSAGYDPQMQSLEIEFASDGQIWRFENVPEEIWYQFRRHHLPEIFFRNFIMGCYPERRMNEIG